MTEPAQRAGVVRWLPVGALVAALALLLALSAWLTATRIYQVDECQNVYVARLLATGQGQSAFTGVTLFLAPLAAIAQGASESVELFQAARWLTWGLFWLNLCLIVVAAGERLQSRRGLLALAAAATLAPLWDYGFEVRHDNLLLTGLLLLWYVIRVSPRGAGSFVVAGALVVALEFVAFKAFVYTVPIAVAAIGMPAAGIRARRLRLAAALAAGGLVAFVVIRASYGLAGWWPLYVRDLLGISSVAASVERFPPWFALRRLFNQTPLLVVVAAAGVAVVSADWWRQRGTARLALEGLPADAFLLVIAVTALVANPAPYPYNLVNVVPFMFLFAWRFGWSLVGDLRPRSRFATVLVVLVLAAAHVAPFSGATHRHLRMPNARQQELMRLAERLTDPGIHPVYDGIGMVPTRGSINYQWFLHSVNVGQFSSGFGPRVRDMLAANPAAVFIPSYRTDWLPEEDHAFIRRRYVPLSDDFWVLGGILPPGGGTVEIIRPGRYGIVDVDSDIAPMREAPAIAPTPGLRRVADAVDGTLDGKPLQAGIVELGAGAHVLTCSVDCRPAVVWVGPRLDRVPDLSSRDHRLLFVNWY